jgi:hypothetical protein
MEGTYEPREDFTPASAHGGCVFFKAEILRRRERAALVRAARIYHFAGKLPNPAPNRMARPSFPTKRPTFARHSASDEVEINMPGKSCTLRVPAPPAISWFFSASLCLRVKLGKSIHWRLPCIIPTRAFRRHVISLRRAIFGGSPSLAACHSVTPLWPQGVRASSGKWP